MPFDKTYKSLGKKPRDPELDELQDLQSGYLPNQIAASNPFGNLIKSAIGDKSQPGEFEPGGGGISESLSPVDFITPQGLAMGAKAAARGAMAGKAALYEAAPVLRSEAGAIGPRLKGATKEQLDAAKRKMFHSKERSNPDLMQRFEDKAQRWADTNYDDQVLQYAEKYGLTPEQIQTRQSYLATQNPHISSNIEKFHQHPFIPNKEAMLKDDMLGYLKSLDIPNTHIHNYHNVRKGYTTNLKQLDELDQMLRDKGVDPKMLDYFSPVDDDVYNKFFNYKY